jgi:hypothetical protein
MTEHWCQEPMMPDGEQCGAVAKFRFAQMVGDDLQIEWFCAEHYDARVRYMTEKIPVEKQ